MLKNHQITIKTIKSATILLSNPKNNNGSIYNKSHLYIKSYFLVKSHPTHHNPPRIKFKVNTD